MFPILRTGDGSVTEFALTDFGSSAILGQQAMSAEFRRTETRNSRTGTRAAIAALFLAVVFRAVGAQAVAISSAEGKVLFLKSGSYTWAQVSTGQVLVPGDQLKTGTGSRATVTFDDASRVDLFRPEHGAFDDHRSYPAPVEVGADTYH